MNGVIQYSIAFCCRLNFSTKRLSCIISHSAVCFGVIVAFSEQQIIQLNL
jgi:hypothetical protein